MTELARRRDRRGPGRPRRRRPPDRARPARAHLRGRVDRRRQHPRLGPRPDLLALALQRRRRPRARCSSATAGTMPPGRPADRGRACTSTISSRWPRRRELAPRDRDWRTRHGDLPPGPRQGRAARAASTSPSCCASPARNGAGRRDLARAVIDASGTWTQPNPLGGDGLPADRRGRARRTHRLRHAGRARARPRGLCRRARPWCVGAGHSAANVLLDLARLAEEAPGTRLIWVVRGTNLARVYGGGDADQLPARGELGCAARQAGRARRDHAGRRVSPRPRSSRTASGSCSRARPRGAARGWPGRPDRRRDRPAPRPRHDPRAAPRPRPLAGERAGARAR